MGNFTSSASSLESCGVQSLYQLCLILGVNINLQDLDGHLQHKIEQSDALSFADLAIAAKEVGLSLQGMKMTFKQLKTVDTPVIAHLKNSPVHTKAVSRDGEHGHFIVVEKVLSPWVRIFDMRKSPFIIPETDFLALWTGNVLVASKLSQQSKHHTQLMVKPAIHDFGVQENPAHLSRLVVLKNKSNTPIRIMDLESDCTCTVGKNDVDNIDPGKESRLKVDWEPGFEAGIHSTTIQIRTNNPNQPLVFVSFVALIEHSVSVIPNRIYVEAACEKVVSRLIKIQNQKYSSVNIKGIESSSSSITIDPIIKTTLEQGQTTSLQVHINMPIGEFSEQITIYISGTRQKKIVIPIDGKIYGNVLLSPKKFFFGMLESVQSASREIRLNSRDSVELKILKTETNLGKLEVQPLEQGKEYLIRLVLSAPLASGIQRGNVRIYTNLSSNEIINVPVFALVHPPKTKKSISPRK